VLGHTLPTQLKEEGWLLWRKANPSDKSGGSVVRKDATKKPLYSIAFNSNIISGIWPPHELNSRTPRHTIIITQNNLEIKDNLYIPNLLSPICVYKSLGFHYFPQIHVYIFYRIDLTLDENIYLCGSCRGIANKKPTPCHHPAYKNKTYCSRKQKSTVRFQ